jgi:hypothetical protein
MSYPHPPVGDGPNVAPGPAVAAGSGTVSTAVDDLPPGMYHICMRCHATARGHHACHCAVCHRTFGTERGFRDHRREGACLDPASLSPRYRVLDRAGWQRWVREATEQDRERMRSAGWRRD